MSTSLRGRLARENARWWVLQCSFWSNCLVSTIHSDFQRFQHQAPPPPPLPPRRKAELLVQQKWFEIHLQTVSAELLKSKTLFFGSWPRGSHCGRPRCIWAWLWLFANSNRKTSPKQMTGLYFRSSGFKAQTRCLITTNLLKTYFGIHYVAIQMERI